MKKNIPWLVMPLLALGLSACDGGNSTSEVTASKTAHVSHDDHDHAGHGHHHGHGERRELGKAEIGRFTVTAAVLGEINAGADSVIDVEVSGATPSAVRAWVGVESAQGSLKARLEKAGNGYHGHVEVPATLPDGSAIWIEIEDTDGKKSQVSFDLE